MVRNKIRKELMSLVTARNIEVEKEKRDDVFIFELDVRIRQTQRILKLLKKK